MAMDYRGIYSWFTKEITKENKAGGGVSMEKDGTKREFEMRKLQYGGTSYTVTLLYCYSDPVKI